MKSLSNIEKFKLSEDLKNIIGGQVSGSFDANGSKFTYCGELTITQDGSISLTVIGIGASGNVPTKDFCGRASYDGTQKTDCAQYFKDKGWVIVP